MLLFSHFIVMLVTLQCKLGYRHMVISHCMKVLMACHSRREGAVWETLSLLGVHLHREET